MMVFCQALVCSCDLFLMTTDTDLILVLIWPLPQDYGNSIDPVSALGLDAAALDSYQMEEVVCGPHLPRPELLPYGYCVGDVDAVLVWLKVGDSGLGGGSGGSKDEWWMVRVCEKKGERERKSWLKLIMDASLSVPWQTFCPYNT